MIIVPRRNTPAGLTTIAATLRAAWETEFQTQIPARLAALLTAQILLETAQGKSIQNNAPGNISARPSYSGEAWRPPWFEPGPDASARTLQLHEAMLKKQAPEAFRAYPTLLAGMRDYLRVLKRNFGAILQATNARELAQAIWDTRYTRDLEPEKTAVSLQALVDQIDRSGVYAGLATSEARTTLHSSGAKLATGAVLLGALVWLWSKSQKEAARNAAILAALKG